MKILVTSLPYCGICKAPPDWNTQSIPRPYRLYFVRGGTAFFRTGSEEFRLLKDHFYLFPSTLPFLIRQDPHDRLDHMFFHFMMTPPAVAPEPIVCGLDDHPLMPNILELMQKSLLLYRPDHEGAVLAPAFKGTVIAALEAFLNTLFAIKAFPAVLDRDILGAVEYLESHYREDLTVRDLAARACLDEDYFIRKFRKSVGLTPYAYLLNLRLGVAGELRAGGMSLSEAAATVGFHHPSSYCHALKKAKKD